MAENKKRLALCMIVKDDTEAESLDRCLSSVRKYVDGIFITGNNGEQEKLKEVCKKHKAEYAFEKWTNFADQRNKNFRRAEKAGYKYILWLDADDTVINAGKIPTILDTLEESDYHWVTLEYIYERDEHGNVTMRHWKPRITKARTGNWVGSVHETYINSEAVQQFRDDDVKVLHHQAPGHLQSSGERNLKILTDEYERDGENTDPRTLYYLANTLMGLQRIEEAIPLYSKHIRVCGWAEEKYFSMHYLAKCLMWVGEYDKALNVSLEATKIFPEWSLAYYDAAEAYMWKKDFYKEIQWILTGTTKEKPSTTYFINDLDFDLYPYARLADAYLQIHNFDEAYRVASMLKKRFPDHPDVEDLYKDCVDVKKDEDFVKSFLNVAGWIRNKDRIKATKLFDALPTETDMDYRIQAIRKAIVPPTVWEQNTIAIYCHPGHEEWAYPSLFSGIGGSEEMVIRLSAELVKIGYRVVVYCRCGTMAGKYQGVEYRPYYHFNQNDTFDTLIIWRYPGFANDKLNANKVLVWLHDIVHSSTFNDKIIKNVDKFLFLSKWHRNNVPELPEEKIYLTRNAIDPQDFTKPVKKKPNSLVWTSSYDRGVLCLARDILPLIEKEIPDVTLDICYGMANIEKEMDRIPYLKEVYDGMQEVFKKKNVTHHGRLPHEQVHDLQAESMIHAYASEFGETFNISSVKAQANGAYVITTSQAGATPEYIRFGCVINGNGLYSDKKLQRLYADEVIKFLKNPAQLETEQRYAIIEEFSVGRLAREWDKDVLNNLAERK